MNVMMLAFLSKHKYINYIVDFVYKIYVPEICFHQNLYDVYSVTGESLHEGRDAKKIYVITFDL